jgi:hypothetical protein
MLIFSYAYYKGDIQGATKRSKVGKEEIADI